MKCSSFYSDMSYITMLFCFLFGGISTVVSAEKAKVLSTLNDTLACEITITNITPVQCFGENSGTVSFFITGGDAPYQVFIGQPGQIFNGQVDSNSLVTIDGFMDLNFTISVTSSCGCSATDDIGGPLSPLMITSSTVENVSCPGGNDGSINIQINGGTPNYTYLWNNGSQEMNLTNVGTGTYSVVITDSQGCTFESQDYVITSPPAITADFNIEDVSCNGGANGEITITPSGGNGAPFSYQWSNSQTSQTITDLPSGTYSVVVKDQFDCTETFSDIFVDEPPAIEVIENIENISCFEENDGSIILEVDGGLSNYFYQWNNNSTDSVQIGLATGDYGYTITDANECTVSNTITITQPDLLAANAMVLAHVSCNSNDDGRIRILPSGGTGVPSALWNNGNIQYTLENLMEGTYSVIITDDNGCQAADTVIVKKELDPIIEAWDENVSYQEGASTNLIYEADQDLVLFNWTVISTNNIDVNHSGYQGAGITPSDISTVFHLLSDRSPGMLFIEVFPEKDSCIGEPVISKVTILPGESGIFIPELITPNEDGINDHWQIVFPDESAADNYSVKIFNRSGGLVYERETLNEQWKAAGCPDGAYFYIISSNNGDEVYKGAVTVLRQ